jgi:hypothetical protein
VRHAPPADKEMACKAEFSGEEMWGKYLDLHAFHERALNLKPQFAACDYATFLGKFHLLANVVPSP